MIAVTVGTISWRTTEVLAANEVAFVGTWVYAADGITSLMVWDAGLNNVRAMTAPEVAALPGQLATAKAQAAKASATAGIDTGALQAGDTNQRLFVAVVGMILDEFNLHKDKLNAILNAIDASTTYATLKTNIAAVPDYPTRTQAQLITALKAKIAATAE